MAVKCATFVYLLAFCTFMLQSSMVSAQCTPIVSNTGDPDGGSAYYGFAAGFAVSFTTPNNGETVPLNDVTLYLTGQYNDVLYATVSLYTNAGGAPGTLIHQLGPQATIEGAFAGELFLQNFEDEYGLQLSPATKYWLVLTCSNTDGQKYCYWGYTTDSVVTGGGTISPGGYYLSGTSWIPINKDGSYYFVFSVTVCPHRLLLQLRHRVLPRLRHRLRLPFQALHHRLSRHR